jgi:predicted AAA+ superfamily ATPase
MNIATDRKLKQLLYIVARSVPFKLNINKIAEMTGVHRNSVVDYLLFGQCRFCNWRLHFRSWQEKQVQKQISGMSKAFIVKDDIEFGYQIGFNY